jgi:hypothetical protein
MKLKVVDLAGSPVLLASEKGDRLYLILEQKLSDTGEKIELDFEGYKFISSTFLNHALGQLCIDKNLNEEQFFNKISILNLSEDELDEVKLCVANAQMRRAIREKGFNENEFYSNLSLY